MVGGGFVGGGFVGGGLVGGWLAHPLFHFLVGGGFVGGGLGGELRLAGPYLYIFLTYFLHRRLPDTDIRVHSLNLENEVIMSIIGKK